MKKLIAILILLCALMIVANENYSIYANLKVWIQRENEIGCYDTFTIDNIVSKTIKGTTTTLRTVNPKRIINICEPKERIIKEEFEE